MRCRKVQTGLMAAAGLFVGAGSCGAQECYDRPFIIKPIIERAIVERPQIIRPIVEKAIVEAPQFVRPVIERTIIERPYLERTEFDWCGDAYLSADGDEGSSLDRSLKNLLESGRFTPGSRFKRSYLHAIRGEKAPLTPLTVEEARNTSCCGDSGAKQAVTMNRRVEVKAPVYRDRPPLRFPVRKPKSRLVVENRSSKPSVSPVAESLALARASVVAPATLVVPRGSR